eukprot:GHVR01130128.1.p1 GENE.GHVR01130128.1~~GHVR01130128.1.p1  ORF type:complete len:114 (-),score=0.74 GHVR01130128.1:1314-1655(-)
MTDATELIPNIPKLLTDVVPPVYSRGSNFPSFALFAKSLTFFEISINPSVSALKTIGVINPPSIATATLTSACLNVLIVFPFHCELTLGKSLKAKAVALTIMSLTLILTPFLI